MTFDVSKTSVRNSEKHDNTGKHNKSSTKGENTTKSYVLGYSLNLS